MKTEPLTIRIDKKLKAEAKKAAKENARSLTKPDREIADRLSQGKEVAMIRAVMLAAMGVSCLPSRFQNICC
jgi:hypothetical protein